MIKSILESISYGPLDSGFIHKTKQAFESELIKHAEIGAHQAKLSYTNKDPRVHREIYNYLISSGLNISTISTIGKDTKEFMVRW